MRFLLLVLLALPTVFASAADHVVVWDFATRDGKRTDVTASLTIEFEEALGQKNAFRVIERRKIAQLQEVISNEKMLRDIGQISKTGAAELKKFGANVVVFGEVFDDIDSGDVTVTVSFQNFAGEKLLIKSVLMRRALIRDATSRRERMNALVESISGVTASSPTVDNVHRIQEQDFIFDLESCTRSERALLCRLLVTNNGEDRNLYLVLDSVNGGWAGETQVSYGTKSRIYDESNNIAAATRGMLSNVSAITTNNSVFGAFLISGRPAKASMQFEGVSTKATTVARLDIVAVDGETGSIFTVTFRNVSIK
jgi:hypothetical protein